MATQAGQTASEIAAKLKPETARCLDALCRRGAAGALNRELGRELGYDGGASVRLNVLMGRGLANVSTHTGLWLATELGHDGVST